ncbi:MAG: pentapeptide repeat-containing protein [Gammaproteobacteria bacterium]|nr:pentapeptide repeat-containing protein [Gammaproteobacteria bacterium]
MTIARTLILVAGVLLYTQISHAAEVNIGDAVKVDEDGVSIGGGVIEVSPEAVKLPGVELNTGTTSDTTIQTGSLAGQVFNGDDFSDSDLSGRSFAGARLNGVNFSASILSGTDFTGAILQGVDFGDADLSDAIFVNVSIQGDDFSNANLTRIDFTDSRFQGADFSNANLQDACFIRTRLTGNDFSDAVMTGAIFTGSSRIGNDFGDADLSAIVWEGAKVCPHGEQLAAARPEITEAAVIAQALSIGENAKVDLTVNFEFDSDQIKAQGHAQILEIANALKSADLSGHRIMIEGHTDNVGKGDYNVDLSYRRAFTVMRALSEQYGVQSSQLQVNGFGETKPVASNETDEGRALNRRVTLVNMGEQ